MIWTLCLPLTLAGVFRPDLPPSAGVGSPSGPTEGAASELRSLDFLRDEEGSRLILGLESPPDTQPRVEGDWLLVDLAGVQVPPSLQRPLDMSGFGVALLSAQVLPTAHGSQLRVRLRDPAAEWELRPRDERWLELLLVEPATPSAPSGSASTSESSLSDQGFARSSSTQPDDAAVWIDERGRRSSDPTAAGGGEHPQLPGAFPSLGSWSSGRLSLAPLESPPGETVSLEVSEASIHDVLRFIGEAGNINLVADGSVSGTVTLRLVEVPWEAALQAVLQSQGLVAQTLGPNILSVQAQGSP